MYDMNCCVYLIDILQGALGRAAEPCEGSRPMKAPPMKARSVLQGSIPAGIAKVAGRRMTGPIRSRQGLAEERPSPAKGRTSEGSARRMHAGPPTGSK